MEDDDLDRIALAVHQREHTDRVWAYLFDSLPFDVRHRWGGDWREFREGVRKCALTEPETK